MADTPTPPSGQGSGSEQVFGKYLAKIGISWDPQTTQQIKKNMDPIQKYILDFNKTTDFKNTFFGKLPGIKKSLQALLPDNVRFLQNMMAIGNASKAGADGMEFYNNNLGFFGKGLTNLTSIFFETGEGATVMGRMVAAGASMATLGIAALIALGIALLQGFKNLIMAGIDWQNQLNDFNKVMGGVTRERLMKFNEGLNQTITSLGQYGFALSEITNTVKAFMVSGLNPAVAMNKSLIETTMKLHEVTGESNTELASFFSSILRGSKIGGDSLKVLGGNFAAFNQSVEASGILGNISFGDVKEAINSVGTALLIASNKSKTATNRMMNDLVALTGLSKALNISVSELNSKFEEAGNLISSQESGFRAILAISGGANIQNMLSNQFNKTEAMLKVSDRLAMLNKQFGGNLNILGQVAEQTFGLSKDVAIKLATMSREQKAALQQARDDAEKMQSSALDKSFKSVTDTLSNSWERFKNILINVFHTTFAGNSGLQNFLSKAGAMMNRWVSEIGNPNSGFGKLVDKLKGFVTKLFDGLSEWLDKLEPWIDKLMRWIDEVLVSFSEDGFVEGMKKMLGDVLTSVVKVVFAAISSAIPAWVKGAFLGFMIAGPWGAAVLGGIGAIVDYFSSDETAKREDAKNKILSDWANTNLKHLSKFISQNKKEQARYEGLKDTDIVIGKNGQFSLAGLEKLELQTEEEKLLEAQTRLTSVTEDNTEALKGLVSVIQDTKFRLKFPDTQQQQTAPPPPKSSVAQRAATYYGGYK
jgi:hypothetical protein